MSDSEYAEPLGSACVRVAAIMPFFRYAVGPDSQHSPAIPYFTRKGAEKCFDEVTRELPWAGAIMYRRTWRGLVTVREYRPNAEGHGRAVARTVDPLVVHSGLEDKSK